MPVLIGWCWFAAAVLLVSLAVHVSTFLGIDPLEKWPGVMLLHLAIFPPFFAAICYANCIGGPKHGRQDRVVKSAPRWLQVLTGVFFAYALVNFAVVMVLVEGGGPSERDGRYFVTSHGTVFRELTEAEYHQQRAYEVRGFSGHWMLFSSAALMGLVGTARLRRRSAAAPAPTLPPTPGEETTPPAPLARAEQARSGGNMARPPEPTTVRAGVVSLVLYLACLAMIFSSQPVLGVVAVPAVTIAMLLAMRRRRGFPHAGFESGIGCLTVFPNAMLASVMGRLVAEFLYLAIYMGFGPALTHEVAVLFPRDGPAQLSNGELLHTRVWAALRIFVMFPLFAVGTIGLTYLAEQIGRLIEVRRPEKSSGSQTGAGA
jgi:hypothetical protein